MTVNFNFIFYFCLFCGVFDLQFLSYAQNDRSGGELNYPCASVTDCRRFGYTCKENTCQCDQLYIPNKERKKCVGGVNQKCMYDEHCIDGAYCMNQSICKCKIGSSRSFQNGLVCAGVSRINTFNLWAIPCVIVGYIINKFRIRVKT